MKEIELEQILNRIKNQNCELPKGDIDTYEEIAKEMLLHIGSSNARLRDELIYEIFDQWIEEDRFSSKQMNHILHICLDEDHLLFHLGEVGTSSVFTRSFSALFIATILHKHNQSAFLQDDVIHRVFQIFTEYYEKENDLRGFVKESGWAHSAAHGADVVKELAQCKNLQKSEMTVLLRILECKTCQGDYVFIDREAERISCAIRTILERNLLEEDEVINWLNHFQKEPVDIDDLRSWHQMTNIQNLYKTLYFALKIHHSNIFCVPILEDHISIL